MNNISLGDRMKMYEGIEAKRSLIPLLPICIRLDGRSFSNYTKKFKKPYDERMSNVMIEVTENLIMESNACIGYTESDEITLILNSDSLESQTYFNGRISKIISVLSSLCSVRFNELARSTGLYEESGEKTALFDCRVWNVPNKAEACNVLVWRERDCTRNSILMSSVCYFSNKECLNKNTSELQEMLFQKGVNWNDYPDFFKRGTYLQRISKEVVIGGIPCKRSFIEKIQMPPFSKVVNKVGVVFEKEVPETIENIPEQKLDFED